jgi:hypothetical protein
MVSFQKGILGLRVERVAGIEVSSIVPSLRLCQLKAVDASFFEASFPHSDKRYVR